MLLSIQTTRACLIALLYNCDIMVRYRLIDRYGTVWLYIWLSRVRLRGVEVDWSSCFVPVTLISYYLIVAVRFVYDDDDDDVAATSKRKYMYNPLEKTDTKWVRGTITTQDDNWTILTATRLDKVKYRAGKQRMSKGIVTGIEVSASFAADEAAWRTRCHYRMIEY